jgi:hypothetical protein
VGWETPRGRGRFYFRRRKVNGRVIREYVDSELLAELNAQQDSES